MITINGASDNKSTVILPQANGELVAIDIYGQVVWKSELGGEFAGNIIIKNKLISAAIYNSAKDEITLKTIRLNDGTVIKSHRYSNSNLNLLNRNFEVNDFNILPTIALDDSFTKINTSISTNKYPTNSLIFGTSNKTLLIYDVSLKKITNQINLKSIPTGKIIVYKDFIYVSDIKGNIYSFDKLKGKKIWNSKTGGKIKELKELFSFNKKYILSFSDDNFVYKLKLSSGNLEWKTRLSGRLIGATILDDNHILSLSNGSTTGVIINLKTGKVINRIRQFNNEGNFVSRPLIVKQKIFIPTEKALLIYSHKC